MSRLGDGKQKKTKEGLRIYYWCEGQIEKYILRITVWHHMACQVNDK